MSEGESSSSTPSFRIFLSHAGEDKETIARPLWERLTKHGLSVFLDEESFHLGDHCPDVMKEAMETAPVGIFILSPEFVAKEWPMCELMTFVNRYDRAKQQKQKPPLLISIFYRLSIRECRDSAILDTYSSLLKEHRFFQRLWNKPSLLADVKHALHMSATLWSIRNDVGATNDINPAMKSTRESFISSVQDTILQSLGIKTPQVASQDHSRVVNESGHQDMYSPDIMVPLNPCRLTLQCSSTNTCEGELRDKVMDESESQAVPVISTGQGGAGKTCALRELARDSKIQRRFPGGILYIELGNNATITTLVQGIANIVHCTGGSVLANEINASSFTDAIRFASNWFGPHRCLFLVDDIWHLNGIDSDVLHTLKQMVNTESKMVYTTRDRHFIPCTTKVVRFREKETYGDLSRQMLMAHAGFEDNTVLEHQNKTAFEYFLEMCQGLPLGFGIIGRLVILYSEDCERKQDAWSEVFHAVSSQQKNLMEVDSEQYGTLPKIVDLSLQVLEKRSRHARFWYWFRALSVLQKRQSVPVQMLQKLWGLETMNETIEMVESFANVSVVQSIRKDGSIYVRLHNLILDIAVRKAADMEEKEKIFQTLVHNYRTDQAAGASELETAWWDTVDDGFIHNNICRMLRNAGYTNQLLWLLSRPQWIVKRLLKGGIMNVEQDLDHGRAMCNGNDSQHANRAEHLEVIGRAARLSQRFVAQNPCVEEAWFQLYGRLHWHATKSELTSKFMQRMEGCAPKPWLRASAGLLTQADCGAQQAQTNSAIEEQHQGHTRPVRCVAKSANGTCIVSGSEDKTARVWNAHTGNAIGQPLRDHTNSVVRVAVSADGTHVVSGDDAEMRLWDLKDGVDNIVLTSRDGSWLRRIDRLELTWNSGPNWGPFSKKVVDPTSEIVLGTCEGGVNNINGGDVYFSQFFSSCRIVR